MGRVIFLLFCAVIAVSGQDVFHNFVNRARDSLVSSSQKLLNRSLKFEELAAPVVNSLQKAVQHSPLLQIPVFTVVNSTKDAARSTENNGNKTVTKRQSFLDGSDTTGYLFGGLGGTRTCLTPSGQNGKCSDLASCPILLLDLPSLRKSICFQNLFTPGVCCPSDSASSGIEPERTTRRPTTTTTTTTTTQRPFILDILQLLSPTSAPAVKPLVETSEKPRPPLVPNIRPPVQPVLSNEIPQDFGQSFKNKDVCGHVTIASIRIVGGEVARVGEWPWMVAIYLTGPNGREYWCGGSLITPKHVLTAAHCTQDGKQKRFDSSQFSVELGRTNLISGDTSKMQAFNVREVRVHPNFRAHGFYNDVAIFTLDGTAKYDDYVRPVCLPSAEDDTFSLVGEIPTVIGFGATDYGGRESNILREVQIPVWRNEDCDRAYIQPITDIFVCAGYADGGKDACQGDSGGPLQLYKNGNWVQIGLVSFGNKCAEPGYPGVYTRLTKFARWIEANSVV